MRGYHVKIGYNGCSSLEYEDMWEKLKSVAREIADDPSRIIEEARRLGAPETCEDGCCFLDGYADNYKGVFGSYGHPITIIDKGEDKQIMQLASIDDEIKYHVRRAYIRLLIEEMHRNEIEVSLIVA